MMVSLIVKYLLLVLLVLICSGSDDALWNMPLFLWQTTLDSPDYHTALLPRSPSDYIDSNSSWAKVFEDPTCYVVGTDSEQPASYPYVTLKAYYSEERGDIQTTTSSLSELNRDGGSYEYLATLGNIRSTPGAGYDASQYVPLTVSYDDASADSATAPLSHEDLNIYLQLQSKEQSYRLGSITGEPKTQPFLPAYCDGSCFTYVLIICLSFFIPLFVSSLQSSSSSSSSTEFARFFCAR